jgi:hypothetical protein
MSEQPKPLSAFVLEMQRLVDAITEAEDSNAKLMATNKLKDWLLAQQQQARARGEVV